MPVTYGPHWPRLPPPASPAPTSLACPHQLRLPPPAWSAPIGLSCPHDEEEGSALVLGIGLQLWQSALSFPSLSFVYKSIVFSFSLYRQTIELLRSFLIDLNTVRSSGDGLPGNYWSREVPAQVNGERRRAREWQEWRSLSFSFSFSFVLGVRETSQFIHSFILSFFYQRGRSSGGSSAT